MKWKLLVTALITGSFAHAADTNMDLTSLSQSALPLIEMMKPEPPDQPHKMPQECADAAITEVQHAAIVTSVEQAEQERLKIVADLKGAMIDYIHTLADATSNAAAGDASGAIVTDGVAKMAANKIALKNKIIYTILKPEQRLKGVQCMIIMDKAEMKKKLEKICKQLP